MLQNHFTGNKASGINKNLFCYFEKIEKFVEIMFAFFFHLLIENFKPESYRFERNNRIWCLNGYGFQLYQTMFHNKNYHNRLFNSMALFVVYKWPLTFSWWRSLSYKSQSSPMDWFLCDSDLRHERVKNWNCCY